VRSGPGKNSQKQTKKVKYSGQQRKELNKLKKKVQWSAAKRIGL
jgi:hypothetical protein